MSRLSDMLEEGTIQAGDATLYMIPRDWAAQIIRDVAEAMERGAWPTDVTLEELGWALRRLLINAQGAGREALLANLERVREGLRPHFETLDAELILMRLDHLKMTAAMCQVGLFPHHLSARDIGDALVPAVGHASGDDMEAKIARIMSGFHDAVLWCETGERPTAVV